MNTSNSAPRPFAMLGCCDTCAGALCGEHQVCHACEEKSPGHQQTPPGVPPQHVDEVHAFLTDISKQVKAWERGERVVGEVLIPGVAAAQVERAQGALELFLNDQQAGVPRESRVKWASAFVACGVKVQRITISGRKGVRVSVAGTREPLEALLAVTLRARGFSKDPADQAALGAFLAVVGALYREGVMGPLEEWSALGPLPSGAIQVGLVL